MPRVAKRTLVISHVSLDSSRAGAAVNFRMELDQRVISCLLGPDTSGPEGLAAVLEAQGPQDRFRCINLVGAAILDLG